VTDQQRAAADHSGYPGKDLGLPEAGQGSVAGMARRTGAIFIDWLLCTLIVVTAINPPQAEVAYWTLLIFAAQDCVFTALTGFTIGKLILRIRVVRLDGRTIGVGWALVRTVLLLTVVPPLITDKDLRGLHDRAANAAVIRV
jgi:uncharacterized RDD family membrane protein YckC